MPSLSRSALVSSPAADLYQLVADVESYPEFLPWCSRVVERERTDSSQLATITVDQRMKGLSFTTRNRLEPDSAIHMMLDDGPFRELTGHWRFIPLSTDACRVELDVSFEFRNRVMGMVMGPVFSRMCDTMVDSFVKRANALQRAAKQANPSPGAGAQLAGPDGDG